MGIKFKVNERFFDKWSAEMAYLLGFIYADGNLMYDKWSRGKYLSVTSTDKEIIFLMRKLMDSEHRVHVSAPRDNRKFQFRLRIGNANLYDSLMRRGLYPNKSLTISFPQIPKKALRHFVRGYFDGDGCVNIYRSKGVKQAIILRKLSVIFTSGNKDFLVGLLNAIKAEIDIKQDKIYNSHRSFQLRLATEDSVNIFKFMYANSDSGFLARKLNIFKEYFNLRPQRIDNDIRNILGL